MTERLAGRRRRHRLSTAASSLVLAMFGTGAGCSSEGGDVALPEPPAVVTVTMREYRLEHPIPVASGRVVFRFVNEGRMIHQPDLLPLAEELPPIDEQLRGETRAAVTPFAGIPPRDPGKVGTFAVDLLPGQRYAFICFARDPDDDESHALQGMTSEFRAGGQPPPTTTTAGPGAATTTTTTTG